MTDRWIVIPNWDGPTGFQHYKDRTPRWIKNYTELMSDDAYLGLSFTQRGVLHGLWLEYARSRSGIPADTLSISRRLGQQVLQKTLDSLNHAGFIEFSASKPLAKPAQPASPELEKRREVPKAVTSQETPAHDDDEPDLKPPTTRNGRPPDIEHIHNLVTHTLTQAKGAAA